MDMWDCDGREVRPGDKVLIIGGVWPTGERLPGTVQIVFGVYTDADRHPATTRRKGPVPAGAMQLGLTHPNGRRYVVWPCYARKLDSDSTLGRWEDIEEFLHWNPTRKLPEKLT
jgi:hypothetical protein